MGDAIRGLFGSMGKLFGLKDGGTVPYSSSFLSRPLKSEQRLVKPFYKKAGGAVIKRKRKTKPKTKPKKKGKDKK